MCRRLSTVMATCFLPSTAGKAAQSPLPLPPGGRCGRRTSGSDTQQRGCTTNPRTASTSRQTTSCQIQNVPPRTLLIELQSIHSSLAEPTSPLYNDRPDTRKADALPPNTTTVHTHRREAKQVVPGIAYLKKTLTLRVTWSPTLVQSDASRLVRSPVLVVSKKPISCRTRESNRRCRTRTFALAPTTVKMPPLGGRS